MNMLTVRERLRTIVLPPWAGTDQVTAVVPVVLMVGGGSAALVNSWEMMKVNMMESKKKRYILLLDIRSKNDFEHRDFPMK